VSAPDGINVARHEQLQGRAWHVWARRALILALAVVPAVALVNLFGQRPHTSEAANGTAGLEVYAPERLRGGLLYMARFTVDAHSTLHRPALVLAPGWFEGMQVNTVTPAPVSEESRRGAVVYRYDTLRSGTRLVVYAQFQVNPTNVGRRSQSVALEVAGRPTLVVKRHVTVLP